MTLSGVRRGGGPSFALRYMSNSKKPTSSSGLQRKTSGVICKVTRGDCSLLNVPNRRIKNILLKGLEPPDLQKNDWAFNEPLGMFENVCDLADELSAVVSSLNY